MKFFKDFFEYIKNMKTKCNVGDTLYILTHGSLTGIEETKCTRIVKEILSDVGEVYKYCAPCEYDDYRGATWEFYDESFGVKVFLNRKDAEIARAEERKRNCG